MRRYLIGLLAAAGALWLGNASLLVAPSQEQEPRIIAHRGVHQVFQGDRSAQTCRAGQIAEFRHDYIENTLPSMQAAFASGADVVEIDVHLTTDGQFAVFHDWTLECQTNGQGVTRNHSMAELRALDLSYGFTSDGQNFPLRGQGIGLMPSLPEVLQADLPGPVMINFKSNDAKEGAALADLIERLDAQKRVFAVYGGSKPTSVVLGELPQMRGYDKSSVKACLVRYAFLGWSGYVPEACQNTLVPVPMDFAPFLWGWPHRFTQRLRSAGSDVILLGPWDGSGFTSGIDSVDTLMRVPEHFDGYIWTNRAELIGPMVK